MEDAAAFFDHGLDIFDELFFVEFFFGSAVGFFETLWGDVSKLRLEWETACCDLPL